jgi:ABC-2 type transport system permease protein
MAENAAHDAARRHLGSFSRIALIVRREFLERVRTKTFILSTILVPVLLGGVMFAPALLSRLSPDKPLKLAVVDETGILYDALDRNLSSDEEDDFIVQRNKSTRTEHRVRRYELEEAGPGGPAGEDLLASLAVRVEEERSEEDRLDAYLVIPADLMGEEGAEVLYYGRTVSNLNDLRRIRRGLTEVLIAHRLAAEGVDPAKARELTRGVEIDTVKISEGKQSRRGVGEELIVIMVYTMFIYANILFYGSALTRSLIEEKMNRIAEVLLSSVTPFQLMAGKIVGIGAVGLAQFFIWTAAAMGFYAFRGLSPQTQEIFSAIEPATLGYFVLFFVLGYFLYSTLFCIVGAMSTSEQEAQNAQMPVVMGVVVAFVLGISLIGNPTNTLTVAVSHFPYFSPIVMFMRIQALTPPAWEIALNVVAILAFIAGGAWVAGRVFRVGVLMTGKKATIPEIVRWIRTS